MGNFPEGIGLYTYSVMAKVKTPIPGLGPEFTLVDKIYVANPGDNTTSVLNVPEDSDTVIGKPIHVGHNPQSIGVNALTHTIYVVNRDDGTVSVIDESTDTVIGKPIPVGRAPSAIAVDESTNTIYVTNSKDNAVSVIDGAVNRVVARVMFNVKPFNTGYVVCDNTTDKGKWNLPLQQQFYLYSGSGCTATPYPGFEFRQKFNPIDKFY